MRLFISNLPFKTTESDLRELLSPYGAVRDVHIATDKETGRSRGFGFAEMDEALARRAIDALNDTDFGGRKLYITEALPRENGRGSARR